MFCPRLPAHLIDRVFIRPFELADVGGGSPIFRDC